MKPLLTRRDLAEGISRFRRAHLLLDWLSQPENSGLQSTLPAQAPGHALVRGEQISAWEHWLSTNMERIPRDLQPPPGSEPTQAEFVWACSLPTLTHLDQARRAFLRDAVQGPIRLMAERQQERMPTLSQIESWVNSRSLSDDICLFALAWWCAVAVRSGTSSFIGFIWQVKREQLSGRLTGDEVWAARRRIADAVLGI